MESLEELFGKAVDCQISNSARIPLQRLSAVQIFYLLNMAFRIDEIDLVDLIEIMVFALYPKNRDEIVLRHLG